MTGGTRKKGSDDDNRRNRRDVSSVLESLLEVEYQLTEHLRVRLERMRLQYGGHQRLGEDLAQMVV